MTTYNDDETSLEGSAPIEGYEFIGSATTWRYTSAVEAVTIDGEVYSPLAGLQRSRIGIGSTRDTPTLSLKLPTSSAVVVAYAFGAAPRSLRLRVRRLQPVSGEWVVIWDGDVTSMAPTGDTTEIRSPSKLAARLSTNVPGLTVRKHCAHWLYDERCRVNRAAFTYTANVVGVSSDGRTVTVTGIGQPDNWLRAGEIVRDSDGERRTITGQTVAVMNIVAPFRELNNGDAVTMYAGCDHLIATCVDKFANADNFAGFSTMPTSNPYKNPISLGGS